MAQRAVRPILDPLKGIRSEKTGAILFFLAAVVILFFGFSGNTWHVAQQDFFTNHQIVMESFVMGRIVKTARDGLFSAGGLPGLVGPDTVPPDIENANYQFQYRAYRDSLPFNSYSAYQSQNGGEGMLFGILNAMIPISPQEKLNLFHGLTALLSAILMAILLLWFYREFGFWAGTTALMGAVFSQWLTVFGRNLWWSIWAFYLPLAMVLYYLQRTGGMAKLRLTRFGLLVFFAVLIKCFFNGFEYITTTLIMMVVPLVYFSILESAGWKKFFTGMLTAVSASIPAILASMTALCFQIAAVEGSFAKGVDHIVFSLLRRSYADPNLFPADYAASLTASPVDVVITYLKGIYLDLNNYFAAPNAWAAQYMFQIRYLYLILLFAVMSAGLLVLLRSEYAARLRRSGRALIAALWFSLLAPLSWLIIFKAHSYVHTFMNNLVWQMPFTLFGFAVCGLAIRAAVQAIRKDRA
jgi:hypothetical protein